MRKLLFILITVMGISLFLVVSAEIIVRLLDPQPTMYPRWKFSMDYGAVLYEDATIVHKKPGRFLYRYHINKYGYRGKAISISNIYDRTNVVVLGDSFAFGTGVNDGEEFPAIMQRMLEPDYDIINLSVGGYGLTQQIRRFYEFGRLYDPKVVILQFCANDPSDNIFNKVIELIKGRFVFRETKNTIAWVKKYLSHSFLQRSQLYNFMRSRVFESIRKRELIDARVDLQSDVEMKAASADSPEEGFYNELLEAFSNDLAGRGIRLIMISVNGQLGRFPSIESKVYELQKNKVLEYVDIIPWFKGVEDYGSPEGHGWGIKAHAILGNNLALVVRPSH